MLTILLSVQNYTIEHFCSISAHVLIKLVIFFKYHQVKVKINVCWYTKLFFQINSPLRAIQQNDTLLWLCSKIHFPDWICQFYLVLSISCAALEQRKSKFLNLCSFLYSGNFYCFFVLKSCPLTLHRIINKQNYVMLEALFNSCVRQEVLFLK